MTLPQEIQVEPGNEEKIKFFVNDEEVVYSYQKPSGRESLELTVQEILKIAGFDSPEGWVLTRDSNNRTYESSTDKVKIEPGESFTATYKGVTPAS